MGCRRMAPRSRCSPTWATRTTSRAAATATPAPSRPTSVTRRRAARRLAPPEALQEPRTRRRRPPPPPPPPPILCAPSTRSARRRRRCGAPSSSQRSARRRRAPPHTRAVSSSSRRRRCARSHASFGRLCCALRSARGAEGDAPAALLPWVVGALLGEPFTPQSFRCDADGGWGAAPVVAVRPAAIAAVAAEPSTDVAPMRPSAAERATGCGRNATTGEVAAACAVIVVHKEPVYWAADLPMAVLLPSPRAAEALRRPQCVPRACRLPPLHRRLLRRAAPALGLPPRPSIVAAQHPA